ncbi:hypothetical protein AGMMS50256_26420 [Betaproteobacteria bacterium]|nr:hypothetical protein AGMMS50256_26420 [Betaproteobacteria bacterium]
MTSQHLNAYFARKAMKKLDLSSAVKKKIDEVLRLMEDAQDQQVRVSDLSAELYPELPAESADQALQYLAQQINEHAQEKGVGFEMKITSGKGTTNRFIWFEGAVPAPNPAHVGDLNAIPEQQIYEAQGIIQKRFKVALSFPGEFRVIVERIASGLAAIYSKDNVLYDFFHRAELARPNLDTWLQRLYKDESELIVVFICADYENKAWCGIEWRAIRELMNHKEECDRIMFVKCGDGEVGGVFGTVDGYIDANKVGIEEIIGDIEKRHSSLMGSREAGQKFGANNAANAASRAKFHDLIALKGSVLDIEGAPDDMEKDTTLASTEKNEDNSARRSVIETLETWATQADGPQFFALLGEYGMGKTIACQRLAKKFHELRQQNALMPLALYFDLRLVTGLDKRMPTLTETLEECMERGWDDQNSEARYTLEQLYGLAETQATVFILDGLDEVLVKLNRADGQVFTHNLLKIAEDIEARRKAKKIRNASPVKILVSCRTHFFRTLRDQKNHFTGQERGQFGAKSFVSMLLLPLSEKLVVSYLQNAFPELDVDRTMETISSVHNLKELSQRPITLKFIAEYLPEIEAERATGKPVHGVTLYERMALRWLERDEGKHHIQPEHKMLLAMHLAAWLWREGNGSLDAGRLEKWLHVWRASDPYLALRYRDISADQLEEDLRTATFLVRDEQREGKKTVSRFRFAHTSLLEFFLAKYLLTAIKEAAPDRWQMQTPSRETLDFLGQMLAEEEEAAGLRRTLNEWGKTRRPQVNELILHYTLLAREKGWPQPILHGLDLQGADFQDFHFAGNRKAPLDLTAVNFSATNLRRSCFQDVILNNACFQAAALTQAAFWDCHAERTVWRTADCSGAKWHDVSLGESDWKEAQGHAPQFLFCQNAPLPSVSASWQKVQILPVTTPRLKGQEKVCDNFFGSDANSCAWSPDGTRLLSGNRGGGLQVWDALTGEKRLEMASGDWVRSCAWSPDGTRLLSGNRGGKLQVWDALTGERPREFFLSGRSELAWEPATGKITHTSGLYWRDFYWESTLPDGSKEQLPIETFGRLDGKSPS